MRQSIKQLREFIKVVSALKAYRTLKRGAYSAWYAGITNDLERRLREHAVDLDNDCFYAFKTTEDMIARAVEDHFLAAGMQGGAGGGNKYSTCIYIYKIGGYTIE